MSPVDICKKYEKALMKKLLTGFLICTGFLACQQTPEKKESFKSDDISGVITRMTEIMVHDVTNPPLAARFFSYACLAGYEVVTQTDPNYKNFNGTVNNYPLIKIPDSIKDYSFQLSALLAMIETAKRIQPSGKLFEQYENRFLDSCKKNGFNSRVVESSMQYALYISKQILAFAKADNYNRISNFIRYTPVYKEGSWYPTPPAYLAAVEPYFNTVRSFTLDSCSQFKPIPPVAFSKKKNSAFYKLMRLNYDYKLTEPEVNMANFWDCNPFAVRDNGHLLVGIKKISPGAHWLGITGIACKQANKNFSETMKIFTLVSMGLMDGFICCWDEKYRSNRIRPESAIRNNIDAEWKPLLQTPPFPEYPSGHSTISATSATILTHFFGENFKYIDSVEFKYGLAPRSYTSFWQAANEAAMSRFYGGIHFMDAIDNGIIQGRKVGEGVLKKVREKIP